MRTRTTKQLLTAGAATLAFALLLPGAYAQAPDATTIPPPVLPGPTVDATPTAPIVPPPAAPATPPDPTQNTISAPALPDEPAPSAPSKPKPRFRIGPEIGFYLPTNSKTRDRFGNLWSTLGLGIGQIDPVTTKGQTAFDLHLLYQKKGDNSVFLAPIGVSYRQALSQNGGSSTPYAGASLDLLLASIHSKEDNVGGGLKTGVGGSVFIGVNLSQNGYVEARYLLTSDLSGFNLSGLNISAGYRF